jgi:hypothetical protein
MRQLHTILLVLLVMGAIPHENLAYAQDAVDPLGRLERAFDLTAIRDMIAKKKAAGQSIGTDLSRLNALGEGFVHREEYERAFAIYSLAAGEGHGRAQSNLGYLYLNGLGTAKSLDEARRWFQRSSDQHNAWGECNLGIFLINHGETSERAQANELLRASASAGNATARKRVALDTNGPIEYVPSTPIQDPKVVLEVMFAPDSQSWQWEITSDSCSPGNLKQPPLLVSTGLTKAQAWGLVPALLPLPQGSLDLVLQDARRQEHIWRFRIDPSSPSAQVVYPETYAPCSDGLVGYFVPGKTRPRLILAVSDRECRCPAPPHSDIDSSHPALDFSDNRVDLIFQTKPSGATLFIGGHAVGETPATVSFATAFDQYSPVVLKKPGYVDSVLIVRTETLNNRTTIHINSDEAYPYPKSDAKIKLKPRQLRVAQ